MFLTLFRKECTQILKSFIFWLYAACLLLFFNSQLGGMTILEPPVKGSDHYYEYGYKTDITDEDVMETGAGTLVYQYYYDDYVTYPVGYAKNVHPDDSQKDEIGDVIYDLTGLKSEEDIENDIAAYFEQNDIETQQYRAAVKEGVTYGQFIDEMKKVADILGPGSAFTENRLRADVSIPVDYEGAKKNYEDLVEKDGLTGGYLRLFCDYMGVILGVLPIFVTATRILRDKRAQMQELVYSRQVSSVSVVGSRFAALTVMHMLPVIILSLIPYFICITSGQGGAHLDYLAWVKYDLGWLLPAVMTVTALGMLLTELTETALAVLVQAAWWFVSVMSGAFTMKGGSYGWNLIPRHNTELNHQGFADGFLQLAANRIMYALLAAALAALTVIVYERKRKGHLRRHGKISRDHKSTLKA